MATYNPGSLIAHDLSCPICFEDYSILSRQRAPKLLLCLHTFCFGCAQKLWQRDGTLECSLCRTVHSGVALNELFDNPIILDHLRKECEEQDMELARRLDSEMRKRVSKNREPPPEVIDLTSPRVAETSDERHIMNSVSLSPAVRPLEEENSDHLGDVIVRSHHTNISDSDGTVEEEDEDHEDEDEESSSDENDDSNFSGDCLRSVDDNSLEEAVEEAVARYTIDLIADGQVAMRELENSSDRINDEVPHHQHQDSDTTSTSSHDDDGDDDEGDREAGQMMEPWMSDEEEHEYDDTLEHDYDDNDVEEERDYDNTLEHENYDDNESVMLGDCQEAEEEDVNAITEEEVEEEEEDRWHSASDEILSPQFVDEDYEVLSPQLVDEDFDMDEPESPNFVDWLIF